MKMNKFFPLEIKLVSFMLAAIFFTVAFLTLLDYNISWDETIHFRRGQAYLHYFLTGDLDYHQLPSVNLQGTQGDPRRIPPPRRSLYQNDYHNGNFFLEKDSGHPPLNGELAALSNFIFFQKLGVLDDISAHHLFNILAAALLVLVVVYFAIQYFGLFAGLVSFLSLVTYPLFWAESHFNIKDPPQTAFFAAAIWAFINSLNKGSLFWLIWFWIFLGLALSTKFNILFLPLILIPYLLLRYHHIFLKKKFTFKKIPQRYLLGLVLGPIITLGIFIGSWPYLWSNIVPNFLSVLRYYQQIGSGVRYQPDSFFIGGFNTYPWQWIFFTTPPLVLILFLLGLISVWIQRGSKKLIVWLWLLWFLVPILRVSLPHSTIYGGVRQIMEFLPAMVLMAGVGAWQVIEWLKGAKLDKNMVLVLQLFLIGLFLWPILVLFKMHPYENVYFNSFIGGLSGAADRNFPAFGNSFGNAYLEGIKWLNSHTEQRAKVALLQGTLANAPLIFFRSDIRYLPTTDNLDEPKTSLEPKETYFSGIKREGEYLMELTFSDSGKDFYYVWEYVNKFLIPVYEIKVDGVAIAKIWKNDWDHTKKEYQLALQPYNGLLKTIAENNFLYITLNQEVLLSQLEVSFDEEESCSPLKTAYVETSLNKKDWQVEKDIIPQYQINRKINLEKDKISYYFAGRSAKHIKLAFDNSKSCVFNNYRVAITVLGK
ncbi:MAG: hypothetical protein UU73_C0001G0150 [Candidatus Daviesbacteria bacterium GW2011_GWA1_41_61]|uniref:Glycosyltransferase RgtA/B/C/D-like domain-containing protein n=1 Tax=Candidatus Daviesbacteria bacterium GW2011_GWA2_40_9 TaxID=1618424 RepID=A0A0G0U1Q4_9BACT|nr:MAG: hypothetical protein UU26_C0001G0015 [Candidatus Daviesbacteria bacterium GW2011_GWC1_40_9]KKR83044.1 MAG: hypothetical protein UU29_C0008G0153 [Candidatus Daviesbacteria bacterium GW2011_GWA2_40_9]KKR92969.1 MAG: hypothetical protein UU44_C0004G0151 [Candidatus Daviesbacteria bacterium GW2011_GWB1_41_15]KKS15513.1 MAG: hypothetical protein UU73_C0001G0150 [Candidatus Daviesbacteria bacterium GW2011_GWA1_41_61]